MRSDTIVNLLHVTSELGFRIETTDTIGALAYGVIPWLMPLHMFIVQFLRRKQLGTVRSRAFQVSAIVAVTVANITVVLRHEICRQQRMDYHQQ